MKRLVLFLMGCGLFALLSAQDTVFSGIVTDKEKNEPLAYVIVMLKTDNGKTILQYVRTDENGRFSIKTSTVENRMLTFSLMGYETAYIPLKMLGRTFRIALKPKSVQMKEVVVKAPKIRTKGDTIVYNVSRYADSQDRTIADVLKKCRVLMWRRMDGFRIMGNPLISSTSKVWICWRGGMALLPIRFLRKMSVPSK